MYIDAIRWALTQKIDGEFIKATDAQALVDKVREYLNEHNIEYETFSYNDLIPFLPQ